MLTARELGDVLDRADGHALTLRAHGGPLEQRQVDPSDGTAMKACAACFSASSAAPPDSKKRAAR
jgi:hypothetical protein